MRLEDFLPKVQAGSEEGEDSQEDGQNSQMENFDFKSKFPEAKDRMLIKWGARWVRNAQPQTKQASLSDKKKALIKAFHRESPLKIEPKPVEKFQLIPIDSSPNPVPFPYKPYPYQAKAIDELSGALNKGNSTILFESPTGTGKTQVVLSTLLNHLSKEHWSGRILYFTRTVSQMSHVVHEVRKAGFKARATILSSKKHLCVNSKVNTLKTLGRINKKCKQLLKNCRCPFDIKMQGKNLLEAPPLADLEDLKRYGANNKKCSYFLSRKMIKPANVIVLSYNYMSNPLFREHLKAYFKDSILVIDEAHNLEQVFEESASIEWSMYFLKSVWKEIKQLSFTESVVMHPGRPNPRLGLHQGNHFHSRAFGQFAAGEL